MSILSIRSGQRQRVFVLGAGVSASCGLPVTSQLLGKVLRFSQQSNTVFADRLCKFVKYLYPNFRSSYSNLPNIENLLSMMETMVIFNEKIRKRRLYSNEDIAQLKRELLILVCKYLCHKADRASTASLSGFVSHLAPDDIVLTFNWDCMLELVLENIGITLDRNSGYWYLLTKPKARYTLLKPHGSVNWFDRREMPPGQKYSRSIGKNITAYRRFGYPKMHVMPYIIPPSTKKEFGTAEIMRIWKDVYRSLCRADEVFIIGYSFPVEDLHSRFVFRAAIRTNIIRQRRNDKRLRVTVVNPDIEVKKTCRRIIGDDFVFHRKKFEDLILKTTLLTS